MHNICLLWVFLINRIPFSRVRRSGLLPHFKPKLDFLHFSVALQVSLWSLGYFLEAYQGALIFIFVNTRTTVYDYLTFCHSKGKTVMNLRLLKSGGGKVFFCLGWDPFIFTVLSIQHHCHVINELIQVSSTL